MNWFASKPKCVILAAGRGTRLLSASSGKPKVMMDIYGKPLIGRSIDYWKRFTDDFIIVVQYKKEQIIEYVRSLPVHAEFVEQPELRGIAHAVSYVRPMIGDKFVLVLGDCLCKGDFRFTEDMEQGVGVWETSNEEDIKRSYSIEIENGAISRVVEKPKTLVNNLCGMGFYFFTRQIFDAIGKTHPSSLRNEIEITDSLQTLINDGKRLTPVLFNGDYINVTFPGDVARVERFYENSH